MEFIVVIVAVVVLLSIEYISQQKQKSEKELNEFIRLVACEFHRFSYDRTQKKDYIKNSLRHFNLQLNPLFIRISIFPSKYKYPTNDELTVRFTENLYVLLRNLYKDYKKRVSINDIERLYQQGIDDIIDSIID